MRPLIGIPCHPGVGAETQRPIFYNNQAYIYAVERAGGVPILIPLLDDVDGLLSLLSRLDGLLISGGIDVDPRHYQEEPHPLLGKTDVRLDELELSLARWALQEDVPTLGICRGMQVLNVAFGGNLYQDLAAQFPGSLKHPNWEFPRNKFIHTIDIEAGSRMEEILGARQVRANSLHHQAVKKPGKGVVITGRAEDGVAELLEVPEHRFMLAAQCHPEEIYSEEPAWARLFGSFIAACANPVVRHLETISQVLTVSTHSA